MKCHFDFIIFKIFSKFLNLYSILIVSHRTKLSTFILLCIVFCCYNFKIYAEDILLQMKNSNSILSLIKTKPLTIVNGLFFVFTDVQIQE